MFTFRIASHICNKPGHKDIAVGQPCSSDRSRASPARGRARHFEPYPSATRRARAQPAAAQAVDLRDALAADAAGIFSPIYGRRAKIMHRIYIAISNFYVMNEVTVIGTRLSSCKWISKTET